MAGANTLSTPCTLEIVRHKRRVLDRHAVGRNADNTHLVPFAHQQGLCLGIKELGLCLGRPPLAYIRSFAHVAVPLKLWLNTVRTGRGSAGDGAFGHESATSAARFHTSACTAQHTP